MHIPNLGNKFYYHEIEGYTVIDKNFGEVGVMKEVVNEAVQPLFCIENGVKEVLIPVVDSIIDKFLEENLITDFHQGLEFSNF